MMVDSILEPHSSDWYKIIDPYSLKNKDIDPNKFSYMRVRAVKH